MFSYLAEISDLSMIVSMKKIALRWTLNFRKNAFWKAKNNVKLKLTSRSYDDKWKT